MKTLLALRINGEDRDVLAAPHKTLLEVLREDLNLTGTKHGCELGECGTCTVLVDGLPVLSCLALPVECQGREIRTVEGMARGGELHPLQQAFAELGAAQCGYCTPGILLTAEALLEETPTPDPGRDQAGPGRQSLPLHRVHQDPRRRRARRPAHQGGPDMKKDRFSIIGQSLPKIDAWAKVVGETKFADDLLMSRMAHGKLLRSPHPHALIKRIDTTRARALPGVYAVITGHDLPRVKFGILPVSQDEEALCVEKVRMVGDAVAAVAAVDEETAERATELIEVEYEPLRPLMSIEDSLAHPEVRIHEYGDRPNVHKAVALQFGDVEAAFAAADLVREDVFFFEGNTHLPMEQHSAVAQWGADGKLTLWSSTQTPHYVHRLLAKILDVPQAHIRVVAAPVGGGFGGKLDPFAHEIAACKLSQLSGRPVKITLTREEVFYVHRGRHPVLMWIKTGFRKDGAITGMHFRSWLDGGAYGSYGVASTFYTGALQTVTYQIPVYKFEGARVFTNKPPCGPKRGHGTPQPRFAMECQIDKAAEQLGLDPADMRRRNLAEPFVKTANHLTVTTIGLGECIDRVVEASGWRQKRGTLPPGKGIGIACSSYLTGAGTAIYWNDMPHSGVVVRADRSGLWRCSAGPPTSGRARTRSWPTWSRRCSASSPRTSACTRPTPISPRWTWAPTPRA